MARQTAQPVVPGVSKKSSGETAGAKGGMREIQAEAFPLPRKEAKVEGGVVGHEDSAPGKTGKEGKDLVDGGFILHRGVADARQPLDTPGDIAARVNKMLKLL